MIYQGNHIGWGFGRRAGHERFDRARGADQIVVLRRRAGCRAPPGRHPQPRAVGPVRRSGFRRRPLPAARSRR
jgi:hypothetical protein